MSKNSEMLEAHVQFELSRWTGDELRTSIDEEVREAFAWLDTVALRALLPEESALELARLAITKVAISDELAKLIAKSVEAAHKSALKDETLVGDLLPPDAFDALAAAVIEMKDLREAITDQVTTSEVYSRLMSHVLYQGIKNYLATENVIARKVPGASTLMKVSSSAISTAAPKLEKAIDKQLTAFVNSNIQDSIRDSKQFLDKVLDDKVLKAVADEVWDSNAKVSVGEYASLVPTKTPAAFIEVGRQVWDHIRTTETFDHFVAALISDFYKQHGKQKVGTLLATASVTPDVVIDLTEPLLPSFEKAHNDGFTESRVRARLSAFYDQY